MSTTEPTPNPALSLWILWGGLLASQILYFVVGAMLVGRAPANAGAGLLLPLTVAAALMGLAAVAVNQILLGQDRLREWVLEQQRQGADRASAHRAVVGRLTPLCVLVWALVEGVTLMGLVLSLAGQISLSRFGLFLAGGIVAHVACLPKTSTLDEQLRQAFP